jgi:hypothetical protein
MAPTVLSRSLANRLPRACATLLAIGLVAACSAPASDAESTNDAPLVKDAASMVQQPDGKWLVACKDGTSQTVTTEQILADDVCQGGVPTTCAKRCASRYSDGSCRTYAPDHCAKAAVCTPHVTERYSDGSARIYGEDFCGSGKAVCVRRCGSRYSDGSCRTFGADACASGYNDPIVECTPHVVSRYSDGSARTYGEDFCSPGTASCVKRCGSRYSDGSCREYSEDFCAGPSAPKCVANCVDRYSDGSCRTYGEDTCE